MKSTALAGPVAAVSFVGGVAAAQALSRTPYPIPGAPPEQITRYFRDDARAARVSVAGQLISATALAVFAVAIVRIAKPTRFGAAMAEVGGILSAATLTTSALTALQLTKPGVAESSAAPRLHRQVFLAGGPLHAPGLGLLVGALAQTKILPRWMSYAALVTAVAGLLAPLSLVARPAMWLIPANRFPGLLLSAGAGLLLSRRS